MHNLRKKREKIRHESSLFLIFGYLLKIPLNARKRCLRQHLFLHGVELRRGILRTQNEQYLFGLRLPFGTIR